MENQLQEIELNGQVVQAARERWESAAKKSSRKHSASFETWLGCFSTLSLRYGDIAEKVGLTQERVGQIYNKFFRTAFDNQSGRDRLKRHVRRTQAEKAQRALFADPIMGHVVKEAQAAGCVVGAVPLKSIPRHVDSRKLVINGHLCSVRSLSNSRASDFRSYSHVGVSRKMLRGYKALIFFVHAPDFPKMIFVVPTALLLERMPASMEDWTVYLPLKRLPVYKNNHPRINYWLYENAWQLLVPDPPASP